MKIYFYGHKIDKSWKPEISVSASSTMEINCDGYILLGWREVDATEFEEMDLEREFEMTEQDRKIKKIAELEKQLKELKDGQS